MKLPQKTRVLQTLTSTALSVVLGFSIFYFVEPFLRKVPDWDWAWLLLYLSAFFLCVFYWIEFTESFDRIPALPSLLEEEAKESFHFNLHLMASGTVWMLLLVSAILWSAASNELRWFLILSIVFWVADLVGSIGYVVMYGRLHKRMPQEKKRSYPADYAWYVGHWRSPYFCLYGLANLLFFATLLIIMLFWQNSLSTLTIAGVVFGATMFRHFVIRTTCFKKYQRKILQKGKLPSLSDNELSI